jgi:hypothetical protein
VAYGAGVTAVIQLLALLAYGELKAFDRLAADAQLAPDLRRRAVLCEMAAAEIANYRRLVDRIEVLGADPESIMRPFVPALDAYHEQTEPSDWLEALTKAYVGDGLADDFYTEIARYLASPDRELVLEVLHDDRYAEFAAAEIRTAVAADPRVASKLSMWGRRLMGESLSQAQRVAGERPELLTLLAQAPEGIPPIEVNELFRRITQAHSARMNAAGLNN